MSKSGFQVFASFGGRAHAIAERKKRHRGQRDAFTEEAPAGTIETDERYTPREVMQWCMKRAEVEAFDLDVAACAESHHAARYYTKDDDGLAQPWDAVRVWCNPPYSDIEPWMEKAEQEWFHPITPSSHRVIAMLLPATKTEQTWWQRHVEPERDQPGGILRTHFLPGRTSFALPGSGGKAQQGSPFGCVLLVWRRIAEPARKKRKLLMVDLTEPREHA